MARQRSENSFELPLNTIVEVIRTKGNEVVKKEMLFGDWLKLKKQSGYVYRAFQKGFSQFNVL